LKVRRRAAARLRVVSEHSLDGRHLGRLERGVNQRHDGRLKCGWVIKEQESNV
jgi:hypothetical protein